MILAEQLTKKFDDFVAVDEVNFEVKQGQVLVLLGPNGAGKTTTVRMLSSILRPTSGRAVVGGFDVVRQPEKVRAVVGVLTEHHGLYGRMNAVEYLDFFGQLYGLEAKHRRAKALHLLGQFGLQDAQKKRLSEFSKGMRQKLALVRAMLHDPQVLLLDEPTSAMDPESARTVREAIASLRSADRSIILCSHNLMEAEILADQVAIIRRGRIILYGPPRQIKNRLLGPVEYEAHFAGELDGRSFALPEGALLTGRGPDWLRVRTEAPEALNSQVIQVLLSSGLALVSFQEVPRSLEKVYLQAVNQAETEEDHVG